MANQPDFGWAPIYRELARRVLDYEHRQGELLSLLTQLQADGLPVIKLMDKNESGEEIPLREIDPFTFFASFNRQSTDSNRRQILARILTALDLQLTAPERIDGIPVVNALASWFFPFQADRQADDIPALWKLAREVVQQGIDGVAPESFNRCLNIRMVGLPKLTVGLYWLRPDEVIPFDKNTKRYLSKRGIDLEEDTYESYLNLLHEARRIDQSPVKIAYAAPFEEDNLVIKKEIPASTVRRLRELMEGAYKNWEGFRDPRFQEEEIKYKEDASKLAKKTLHREAVNQLLRSEKGVSDFISRLKTVAQATNLLYLARPSSGDLALLYNTKKEDQRDLCLAVFDLLHGEGDSPERLQRFADWQTDHGLKPKWTFPTYFLFLLRPEEDIFIKPRATKSVLKNAEIDLDLPSPPTEAAYRDVLAVSQGLIQGMGEQNARDMFDIQSMIWVCNQQLRKKGGGGSGGTTTGGGEPSQTEPTFDGLLKRLEEKGLYFPDELVSNFLLALQSKRFVLLTGISGTGKTQLALEVADYFRPKVTVRSPKQPSEDAFPITVQPYMLKHNQLVLPVVFVAEARFPETTPGSNSVDIQIAYPHGEANLRMWRDPTRNVTTLSLKGEIREWFSNSVNEGDVVFLSTSQDPEAPHIELALAEFEEQEGLLDNYVLEAVRPDWTDNRGLLGYFNPLTGRYTSTPFLDLLLRSNREADEAAEQERTARPFFAILDEMNLARVEHYFSDFLSAMESQEPIHLHNVAAIEGGDTPDGEAIPRQLRIPDNLFFVGTVNIDESTYMFSPKVLDRAFTLELNDVDLPRYSGHQAAKEAPFRALKLPNDLVFSERPNRKDWTQFGALSQGDLQQHVISLNEVLATENRHFGYRVANEIARFVLLASEQVGTQEENLWTALDLALLAKALPKLHGTQQELEPVLDLLFVFAVRGRLGARDDDCLKWTWTLRNQALVREIPPKTDGDLAQETRIQFPLMARKLHRMRRRLRLQGFTSFIE